MFRFTNAQKMHEKHPTTFYAPSKEELDKLKVGDIVKVSHGAERFWCIVKEMDGDRISAEVNNSLVTKQPFNLGDRIIFKKHHIYSIYS